MEKLFKSACFLMSLAAAPVWAQWAEVAQVTVSPTALTERSQIGIHVRGEQGDPCHILTHEYTLDANKIVIDVTMVGNPVAICLPVVVPYEFTEVVGSLSAGEYTVEVRINDTPERGAATFTVMPNTRKLALAPATGTYLSTQEFDFALVLESELEVVSAEAFIFGQNSQSTDRIDISLPLGLCLRAGVLEPHGRTYRCPAITERLGEGTYTILVNLKLSDQSVVSDAVTWTILGAIE